MIKIIVNTEDEKKQLIYASTRIHDAKDIDTDIPMINTLAHLYLAPHLIIVDDTMTIDKC